MSSNSPHIAVIGAGAAGIAAAKYLLAEGFSVTIIERKAGAGGVWNTAPGNGYWPSPVYDGLETNVPRTLMTFSDFPWPANASLFPTSTSVRQYLQDCLKNLQQSDSGRSRLSVEYRTEVTDLRKSTYLKAPRWKIESTSRPFGQPPVEEISYYSAVVVSIGNYHKSFVPEGLRQSGELSVWEVAFPGSLLHSVDYQKPESFAGQTVLVVGNSALGWDISAQLANIAKMVIVSSGRFDPKLQQQALSAPTHVAVPAIQSLDTETQSVIFTDGRAYTVDRIIFCTGYVYDFSFIKRGTLTGDEQIFDTGLRVGNVYEHIFYTEDQTLAFVGLPKMSAAFTVAEAQSAVVARLLSDRITALTRADIQRWAQSAESHWKEQMRTGQASAGDYHSFRLAEDKDYVNMLLIWSMTTADDKPRPTMFGDDGQPPPFWCSCLDKARSQGRAVRTAFKARGDDRHQYATHQSLGFELRAPCADGIEKVYETRRRCRSCFI